MIDNVAAAQLADQGDRLTSGRLALLAGMAALGALATNIMLPRLPGDRAQAEGRSARSRLDAQQLLRRFRGGQLFVGPLSDAFGRSRFVLGGLVVFIGGSLVCAIAPTLAVLIAGRAMQAFGACAASVLARVVARDLDACPRTRAGSPEIMIGWPVNRAFFCPALAVSLVIGCLYSLFGAAPAILMTSMGLSSVGLSIFFAATVLVVFGSGMLTGPLARRWGASRVGMAGTLIALAGGIWLVLQAGASAPAPFMAAVTLFLAGMGLVNPVATGPALEPFGDRAGIALALPGFLQMACAAIGTAVVGAVSQGPAAAYAWIVLVGTFIAAVVFFLSPQSPISKSYLV